MKIRGLFTIRLRLTALYAGLFFLAGALLIASMYFYLDQASDRRPSAGTHSLVRQFVSHLGAAEPQVTDDLLTAIVAQAEQNRRDTLRTMLMWSLVALGAVGVAASGFGWLLAGRVLQPLQQITATARRVADNSLHERIALDGPDDEVKDLADTFDAMLERLDRAFDGQHRFVANASHELRTPLAINRTLIEVALDDPDVPESTRTLGATLLGVNDRHERLVDGLLILASSEQELQLRTRVDLADVAGRAIITNARAAQQAGVDIRSDLKSAAVVGDPALLERLVHNLIDNACRYNLVERGWVGVRVDAREGFARMTVENTGPIIEPHEIDSLFEPFRRLIGTERITDAAPTAARRGAGLGLSIVRSVATAHGGRASAAVRLGGGLTITVTLPTS